MTRMLQRQQERMRALETLEQHQHTNRVKAGMYMHKDTYLERPLKRERKKEKANKKKIKVRSAISYKM